MFLTNFQRIQREDLLRGDFSTNIKILQNYPNNVDIQQILAQARRIRPKNKFDSD